MMPARPDPDLALQQAAWAALWRRLARPIPARLEKEAATEGQLRAAEEANGAVDTDAGFPNRSTL
jgi:hypothetical protein